MFPGAEVGTQFSSSMANPKPGFSFETGNSYADRDKEKGLRDAITKLQEIMPATDAQLFATTLASENQQNGVPVSIFILVDSWASIKAAILTHFKGKTTAATLYTWVVNYITKYFGVETEEYQPNDRAIKDLRDATNQSRQDLADQRAADVAEVTNLQQATDLAKVSKSQLYPNGPTPTDAELENEFTPGFFAKNMPYIYVMAGEPEGAVGFRKAVNDAIFGAGVFWEIDDKTLIKSALVMVCDATMIMYNIEFTETTDLPFQRMLTQNNRCRAGITRDNLERLVMRLKNFVYTGQGFKGFKGKGGFKGALQKRPVTGAGVVVVNQRQSLPRGRVLRLKSSVSCLVVEQFVPIVIL